MNGHCQQSLQVVFFPFSSLNQGSPPCSMYSTGRGSPGSQEKVCQNLYILANILNFNNEIKLW